MKSLFSPTLSFLKRIRILIVVVLLLTGSGCGEPGNRQAFTIGFSQCVESDAWRRTMLEEMRRELSFHPGVRFIYRQADGSSEKQVAQVKELIKEDIDLLIISPNEAEPLTPIVEAVFNHGTPVIVVDRKISSPFFTAFVGGDNYQIGKMAGEYAVNLLKGKRNNIIEITGLPRSTPAMERHRGFTDAIKNHPSLTLTHTINGEWYKQKAKAGIAPFVSAGEPVDLVFAQNDMMASGTYEVYNSKGLPVPKIIGVDGLPCNGCGMEFVSEKMITATMLYPTGGEEAIRLAMKILNKEPFSKENKLQTTVIDSTNVQLMQLQANKVISQQQSIERQRQMIEEQRRIYKSQRNLLYILVGSLVLVFSLGAMTFYSLRQNRKINKQLRLNNIEILEQKNKIELMSAKAQEANNAKVNFFTNISHEFRTPLTLILGPLEELLANPKSSGAAQSLLLIQKNVIRLLRLVNQLMDFRKIEVEKMKVRASENDIISFVSEIMDSYKSIAHSRHIDLRLLTNERQLNIWFDASMIDKVIFNLLSNAFKFTKDNGYIYVHINKTDDGKQIIIKVEDNGVGMTKDAVENAFNIFYQGEYENYKGSGLGLALSKDLVQLHKGNISVKSEKWKGTTFQVSLLTGKSHFSLEEITESEATPAVLYEHEKIYTSDLEGEQVKKEVAANTGSKEYSILIIEDNPELRGFLVNKLSPGYDIIEADNGPLALQQAFDTIPDLIICDVVIPGKDGIALTNILKNDIRTSHIPIVLLTAKTNIDQQIEGMKNMADAYITKPFNVQFLEQNLKSLLANRARLKEHFTGDISSNLKTQSLSKLDRKFISEFTSFVESNVSNEELKVEDICLKMGVSKMQLYRKVKALLNTNVNDYIIDTRLQKAKYFLQHEELSISEIAYKVGFSSPAYFGTVFKSKFGLTPKAFKEK